MFTPAILALPQKMTLTQGNPLPLPRHFNLSVTANAGFSMFNPANVALYYGNALQHEPLLSQETKTRFGLNHFTRALLFYAMQNGLWANTTPLVAVQLGGPTGLQQIARSNVVDVVIPVAPCTIQNGYSNLWNTNWGSSDSPNPLRLAAPNGRRLYFTSDPGVPGTPLLGTWYVTSDNRLETQAGFRGFDRFTFWLSLFGVAIKDSMKVSSGDALASLLGAYKSETIPMAVSLKDFIAAAGPNGIGSSPYLLWTGSRVVMIRPFSTIHKVREWSSLGDTSAELSSWIASQNPAEVWNVRKLGTAVTPKIGSASTG